MPKLKYTQEFELNVSPKIIFPYLLNPKNLEEWFAQKVMLDDDKIYNFFWENTEHFAHITHLRTNHYIKYEFLDNDKNPQEDTAYIEFRIQQSEFTNTSFLKITDYSDMTSEKELKTLWDSLLAELCDCVGI